MNTFLSNVVFFKRRLIIAECAPLGKIPDDNEKFIMCVKTGTSSDIFTFSNQVGIGSSLLDLLGDLDINLRGVEWVHGLF